MKKSTVTCNVGVAQSDNGTIKCEKKKIKVPPNIKNIRSNVMLVLSNVTMEPSNMRKKIREPLNMTKVQSHVMLILHNTMMVSSNVIF